MNVGWLSGFLALLLVACGSSSGNSKGSIAGGSGTAGTGGNGTGGDGTAGAASGNGGAMSQAPVSIMPAAAHVIPGGSVTFSAVVNGSPTTTVAWTIKEGASGGTITDQGLYTAPTTEGTYHIVATSSADATVSGTATATVVMPRSCTAVPAKGAWDTTSISPVVSSTNVTYMFEGKSMAVVVDPFDSSTVWLGTGNKGLYKSMDCGGTWKKVNTGKNGDALDKSALWNVIVDPVNQGVIYALAAYGAQGVYKSTDSGVNWVQLFTPDTKFTQAQKDNFVSNISMDPSDPLHLVAASHGACKDPNPNGCFAETFDGGKTWPNLLNMPAKWGEQGGVQLLSGLNWVWGTADNFEGMYVTIDGGKNWTHPLMGRAGDATGELTMQPLTRAVDGAYYITSLEGVLRSTDGVEWKLVWGQDKSFQNALVTGIAVTPTTIYAADGKNFFSAPLKDYSNWSPMVAPKGNTDSAQFLAYDAAHHLLYASCWSGGVFRYTTE